MPKEKIKLKKWDFADYLKSEKDIAEYLAAVIEDNDPDYIPRALGAVARARGMAKIAKKAGISRQGLYSALDGNGKPEFATILKVIDALGFKLSISPV